MAAKCLKRKERKKRHFNAVSDPGLDSDLGKGEWGCYEGQFRGS